ncbi:MAG TPA: SDR family oxidoreductase [Chitinophagaceae bacterium]|nr:SDR family oxidoreductase [Chitinophagaceae bacterium]
MKILVVGASGLVGGHVMKCFSKKGYEVIGTHFSYPTENTVYYDSLNLENSENFDVQRFQPDVIVHCGALTHVDYAEEHEMESFDKTVKSTQNLLELAQRHQSLFVFLSTDYVFNGHLGPYTEPATPRPLNVYGEHKLIAERFIINNWDQHLILRVTNVYGEEHRGKNFIARIAELARTDEEKILNLPVDQFANPTYAGDIAKAIELLVANKKYGIYHFGGMEYMNRVNLANLVLDHYENTTVKVNAVETTSLNQAAMRPLRGGFVNMKFLKAFPDFRFMTVERFLNQS